MRCLDRHRSPGSVYQMSQYGSGLCRTRITGTYHIKLVLADVENFVARTKSCLDFEVECCVVGPIGAYVYTGFFESVSHIPTVIQISENQEILFPAELRVPS